MSKPSSITKKPRISVVIPAYNEEVYITACLEAVAEQTYQAFEVIVIDNGSHDQTAAFVRLFPGVRLLSEPRRGIFAAVNTGFNAARGTIIARTDADSRPDTDWLAGIAQAFENKQLDAVSGPIYYYDLPLSELIRHGENFIRSRVAAHSDGAKFLTGANMGIRRQAWTDVRGRICRHPGLHEDLDLAIHLQENGGSIGFFSDIVVATSARRITARFRDFYKYLSGYESIYVEHGIKRSWVLKVPFFCYVPFQPLAKVIYKLYNAHASRTTMARLAALFQSSY
jgi:glycosyltransferase involved in cell wall biosynthesis